MFFKFIWILFYTIQSHHGRICPFECQKVPELSSERESIIESRPLTDSSVDIPFEVKPVIRVLTNPGCKIATAIPRGFRSIDNDFPAMQRATFDMRYP